MSNTDGLLINNNNIYGLVNPPPIPDPQDKAKTYQDPSSAAVRWDRFVDLSNVVFDLSQQIVDISGGGSSTSRTFVSIIDKVPYATSGYTLLDNVFYPLYQMDQVLFPEDKTFSKIRLYLKGRVGNVSGLTNNLKVQLPNNNMINNTLSDANWAGCRRSRKSTSGGVVMIGAH